MTVSFARVFLIKSLLFCGAFLTYASYEECLLQSTCEALPSLNINGLFDFGYYPNEEPSSPYNPHNSLCGPPFVDMRARWLESSEEYDRTWLLNILSKEPVCFADIAKLDSPIYCEVVFKENILWLMHHYENIEEKDGKFYCSGKCSAVPMPTESVAVAMFNVLSGGVQDVFQVIFQLYRQGYREYTPEFLTSLEIALHVGGIHPREQEAGQAQLLQELKDDWRAVQDGSKDAFIVSFASSEKQRCGAIQRLLELKDSGDLAKLQAFKRELFVENPEKNSFVSKEKGDFRRIVMDFLLKNKNVVLDVQTIFTHLQPKMQCVKSQFLKTLLTVALQNPRIIYDKDESSVQLLDKDIPAVPPKEGTSLVTMLYDLIHKYGSCLTKEEIAYYAQRGGYWREVNWASLQCFYHNVKWYENFLAVRGDIALLESCRGQQKQLRQQRARHRDLWKIVEGEKVLRSPDAYSSECGFRVDADDLNAMGAIKKFIQHPDGIIFMQHVAQKKKEPSQGVPQNQYTKFIKGALAKRTYFYRTLMFEFNRRFDAKSKFFWKTVESMMCAPGPGLLAYDLQKMEFYWDASLCPAASKEKNCVIEAFVLRKNYPNMPAALMACLLRQQGFGHAKEGILQTIFHGLELLGLDSVSEDQSDLDDRRAIVNTMLVNPSMPLQQVLDCAHVTKKIREWRLKSCREVVSWVQQKYICPLWKSYLEQKRQCEDIQDVPPTAKRYKLQESMSPEDVVVYKLPAIHKALVDGRVWQDTPESLSVGQPAVFWRTLLSRNV